MTMGTFAAVSLPAARSNDLDAAADCAKSVMSKLEKDLSVYSSDSGLSKLNAAAGVSPVALPKETLELLRRARRYAEASGGAFDHSVGPVVRAWGFSGGRKPVAAPSADALRQMLERVGWTNIEVGDDTAFLKKPGMFVDLGGIAKGYAVDRVLDALDRKSCPDVLVDLGGNVACLGEARRGVPWRIGVRNPFNREELIGILRIPSGAAVATSGNYERFVEIDGRRYAHIIDPRSGRPVEGMASVTVISPDATESDALSTALFVAGVDEAKAILARLPGNEAMFIPDKQPPRAIVTPGFRRVFDPFPEWAGRIKEW
jgi:thiamine biosynthesis lipoprotein